MATTSKILRTLTVPLLAAAAAAVPAVAAHAATPKTYKASTVVTGRPDSGNGGTWAYDTFARDIAITLTGGGPGAYTYTARLTDSGGFSTITGALTPNQGAPYTGETIKPMPRGAVTSLAGWADFTFTASSLPTAGPNLGVATQENDHRQNPADSTSTWYELAFPAGTVFGGAGIGDWSWTYTADVPGFTCRTLFGRCFPVVTDKHEKWVDSSSNADGNLAADGNITGG